MLRILRHPNILPCLGSFVSGDSVVVVSPLQDYGSVTDVVSARFLFGLPERACALILHDVLVALAYIHARDKIHRGLSAAHVLLSSTGSGSARIAGFRHAAGLKRHGSRLDRLHDFGPAFLDRLLWLAPEVLAQDVRGYDALADVYALGITAVEMANGFPPFADMDHMQVPLPPLAAFSSPSPAWR